MRPGAKHPEDCRTALKYGSEVDVTVDHRPFSKHQLRAFRYKWSDEDKDRGRFVGQYRCPKCGMRAMTNTAAVACCGEMQESTGRGADR